MTTSKLNDAITTKRYHDGYRINTLPWYGLGCYVTVLDKTQNQLESLLSYHSRIWVLRFDLHLPDEPIFHPKLENEMVSLLSKMVKEKLGTNKWMSHKRVVHAWVREVGEESGRAHYHMFLAFDARQKKIGILAPTFRTGIWKLIADTWQELSGGTVYFCYPRLVNRDDPSAFRKCVYHLSYLAKTRTKEVGPEFVRAWDFSRLKRKPEKTVASLPEKTISVEDFMVDFDDTTPASYNAFTATKEPTSYLASLVS